MGIQLLLDIYTLHDVPCGCVVDLTDNVPDLARLKGSACGKPSTGVGLSEYRLTLAPSLRFPGVS